MSEAMSIDGIEPEATPAPRAKRGPIKPRGRPARIREEAPVRTEAVREPVRAKGAARTRRRNVGSSGDRFHVPSHLIPEGSSVEWKRHTVWGKDDQAYDMSLLEAGWLPVQADQIPGLMREGYAGPVTRDGLMLYERPVELTDEARREDLQNARTQMRAKEEQLSGAPAGHFARDEHPQTRPSIKKSYEPMAIPEE